MVFYSKSEFLQATLLDDDDDNDDHHHHPQLFKPSIGETSGESGNQIVHCCLQNNPQRQQYINPSGFCNSNSPGKLSFSDTMRFVDFGPEMALNQTKTSSEEEAGINPVFFLKFPVSNNDRHMLPEDESSLLMVSPHQHAVGILEGGGGEAGRVSGSCLPESKRRRARAIKTSQEVESKRMTHIVMERNRRKQMNEHLRVLRSLMPASYVQRGDQASIIGGVIEFVRELEQLLQCLESRKRRRLLGEAEAPKLAMTQIQPPLIYQQPAVVLENHDDDLLNKDAPESSRKGEEFSSAAAESNSRLADVEVKMLGLDAAMINILSTRRPRQLINTIVALEHRLHLIILHTSITTIDQTVLYSFNVKVGGEVRFTAEDIASSVQQIFSFIHGRRQDLHANGVFD